MEPEKLDAVDHVANQIDEMIENAIETGAFREIEQLLRSVSGKIGSQFAVELSVVLDVIDHENERSLRILNSGVATGEDGSSHRIHSDASIARFIVDGDLAAVPNDQCPKCWNDWLFKFQNRNCPSCDAVLGENVRALLDSDLCPHCERGKLSMQDPSCSECGFTVDPECVAWG